MTLAFPVRVNIAASVAGPAGGVVRDYNKCLAAGADSEIVFEPLGVAHPHATYLMGLVGDGYVLSSLLEQVRNFASNLEPREYELGTPHYANGHSGFIFASVLPTAAFIDERAQLLQRVEGLLKLERHGGLTNPPHVTLGYLSAGGSLSELCNWPDGRVTLERSEVFVSVVGPRGTSIEVLDVSATGRQS